MKWPALTTLISFLLGSAGAYILRQKNVPVVPAQEPEAGAPVPTAENLANAQVVAPQDVIINEQMPEVAVPTGSDMPPGAAPAPDFPVIAEVPQQVQQEVVAASPAAAPATPCPAQAPCPQVPNMPILPPGGAPSATIDPAVRQALEATAAAAQTNTRKVDRMKNVLKEAAAAQVAELDKLYTPS